MNGSSSTYTLSDSNGIITGPFRAVEHVEHVLRLYEAAVAEAVEQFAASEKRRVRRLASSLENNWSKLRDSLNVRYDYESGDFVYEVEGDDLVKKMAAELEYGTPEMPPSSLIRSSALDGAQVADVEVSHGIRKYIDKRQSW